VPSRPRGRYAARAEREVSRPKLDLTAGEEERDPAFEDVEGLVGRVVDVQRRHVTCRHLDHLHDSDGSVRVLAVRQDAHAVGEELERVQGGRRAAVVLRTLRLGGFFTAWTSFLPSAVASYAEPHPHVQLELRQLEPEPALRALRAGDLDLAVIYRFDPVEDGLSRSVLFDDPYVVAVPAGHRLARRRAIPLAQLAGERWVSPPPDAPYTRVLVRMCREHGFEPDVAFETIDIAMVQPLVAAGLAISVLPALAPSPLQAGVAIRPLEGDRPARTLEIVEPAGRRMPAARAMAEAIRAAAGKSVAAARS
jgi:DNA-binding transcriptional LysR family regulator